MSDIDKPRFQEIRPTYYGNDCPNGTHVFALLDRVDVCVYCWVKDYPPKTKAPKELTK